MTGAASPEQISLPTAYKAKPIDAYPKAQLDRLFADSLDLPERKVDFPRAYVERR
jgi:hypothetical protein